MLAALGEVPSGPGWAFEWKWDGQRAIAVVRGGQCHLYSRNGNDVTNSFPELAEALSGALHGREGVVDGEVVALDEKGRPSFARLQRRMHVQRPTAQLLASSPVSFFVFDVLDVDGQSTTSLPYLERRGMLADLVEPGPRVQVPPHQTDVDGRKMLDLAREHGLEASRPEFAPKAGSPKWLSEWNARDSDAGRVRTRQHLLLRIALAASAHITPRTDIELARQMGIPQDMIERAQGVHPRPRKRKSRNISDGSPVQPALW